MISLSVIIPAFNESNTIEWVINSLLAISQVSEIIIIDDASTDNTVKKIKQFQSPKIHLIQHEYNQGKGAAIRTGLAHLTGSYVLIQDADKEYNPKDIPALIDPIEDGRVEVVYGSRFIGARTNMFYWHFLGNIFLNWIVNLMYNGILSDMETGYKLLPSQLMRDLNLESNDFRIEPEITCKLMKRHVKIMEVPISYVGRTYAEGKKITWRDGFKALQTIISNRF